MSPTSKPASPSTTETEPVDLDKVNLCDLAQFEHGCPEAIFKQMRKTAPVWYQHGSDLAPDGEGFWVVCKHAEVKAALKNHQDFSSETGYGARAGGGTTLADMSTDMAAGQVLSMMDPPKHDQIRGLVSQGFYPRTLEALEPEVRRLTRRILEPYVHNIKKQIAEKGSAEVDFLEEVATQLPLHVICTIGGLPEQDWPKMVEWADAAIHYAAHDKNTDTAPLIAKMTEMGMYAYELIQKLRAQPTDSVMSIIVNAEIEGADGKPRKLDDIEAIRFFNLLITGGTETTRNAIAYGYYVLLQHPEQYRALEQEPEKFLDGAIEEVLRWTSPVHFNRRTAARDVEFGGAHIKRGEKLVAWYPSANRDEDVFEDAYTFNIYRKKNPHVAFGHGIHHCLGAALARMELKVVFEELLKAMQGLQAEPANEIRFIRSNRHQGVAEMRVRVRKA